MAQDRWLLVPARRHSDRRVLADRRGAQGRLAARARRRPLSRTRLILARARRHSIDVYRGFALLAMAAYHACWDLNYYGLINGGIGIDPVWITAQRSILTAFLLLAGAGLALGHADGIRWRAVWR